MTRGRQFRAGTGPGLLLLQREFRQPDDLAAFFGRLVGADADAGPVGRRRGVGPGIAE